MNSESNFLSIVLRRKNLSKFFIIFIIISFTLIMVYQNLESNFSSEVSLSISDKKLSDQAIIQGSLMDTITPANNIPLEGGREIINKLTSKNNINSVVLTEITSREMLSKIWNDFKSDTEMPNHLKITTKNQNNNFIEVSISTSSKEFAEFFSRKIDIYASELSSSLVSSYYKSLVEQLKHKLRNSYAKIKHDQINSYELSIDELEYEINIIESSLDKKSIEYTKEDPKTILAAKKAKLALYRNKAELLKDNKKLDYATQQALDFLDSFLSKLDNRLITYKIYEVNITDTKRVYGLFLLLAGLPLSFLIYVAFLSLANFKRYYYY